ncbi:MAG TPA: hypothetical protein VG474_13895, partial [Solirubrobacteraceae bacterium]|nr:hypothetical protein [Solirubrobacteraceae bacterium]
MHVRRRLLATLLGLVALVAAGCGEEPRDEQAAVSQRLEASPDAKAVELRAELASLLEEEVFLITHAVRSGARAGFDSELYDAAEKELERTTEKLVDTLSPLFDARRKDGFRRRLDRLVDLALGYGREQVEPGRADVAFRREIDESRAALASILADSSRALSEKDLANHLELTLDELLLALDRLGRDRR